MEFDGITNWSDFKVVIVYSIGPLFSFLTGLILIRVLDKSKYLGWKLRLFLTWIAFVLIHLLPLGMLSGVLFSQDFGFASTNFFMTPLFRGAISAAMLVLAIYFRPLWLKLFSRAAYSHRIIDHKETFIKWVFIRSWGLGFLVLSFFASIGNYWSWLTQIALMGFVILPFFNWTTPKLKLRLTKLGGEEIFKYKITPYLYSALIIALLVLAQVLMNFLS